MVYAGYGAFTSGQLQYIQSRHGEASTSMVILPTNRLPFLKGLSFFAQID